MHCAAENGHDAICSLIMKSLTDKNPWDANGLTPLHLAAKFGHFSVCEAIIKEMKIQDSHATRGIKDIRILKKPSFKWV